MAQTGFTPLQIYSSPTTTNVPLAANLVAGELAINTADGKLFYKDSGGNVQVLATKGGVGASTTTQVLYNSSGLVVGSANLTFDGTKLAVGNILNSGLTASQAVFTDASKNLVSNAITGTGNVVMSTSPTLVTPALGTPSALVGTNITGTAAGLTAGSVTTNANLTGAVTSAGNTTSLGSFTSLQLLTALTNETGTGSAVFATSPTLVTPILGTPTSGVATNLTGLPLTTGVTGTLPVGNGGTGVTTSTGSGANVLSTSPTLVTPLLGTPTSGLATNLTGLPLTTGVTGVLPVANGGTNLSAVGASGNVLTSNGTTWESSTPAAGVSLSAANTWSATQTFNGSASTLGTVLLDSAETVNIVAAAPAATTILYVQSGSVQYYTSNAANNFIVNLAFSAGTAMNAALAIGQVTTASLITTQNATAYYGTAVQVDGTVAGVTTKWIGGAPIAGNANGLDTYRFAVIKTAASTYTVLASLTQYK